MLIMAVRVDGPLCDDRVTRGFLTPYAGMSLPYTDVITSWSRLTVQLIGIADPSFWTRFGVSYGLFLGALRSGATPNQLSKLSFPQYWHWRDGQLIRNKAIGLTKVSSE